MPQYPTPLDSPAISLKKIIINTGEISGGVGGGAVEVGIVQRVDETDPAGGTYTCADLKTDNVFYYNSDTVTDAANVTINLPANPRILQTLRVITSIGISNLYLNAPVVIGSVASLTAASSVSLQCIDEVTKTWVIYCSN